MRILLIEDEPLLGEAVATHLKKAHAVDWLQSLDEGSEAMHTVAYDLLLLDLNLPDGHGMDLLRSIRGSGRVLPVIVITARDQVRHKRGNSAALGRLSLKDFTEGPCVQTMHIGPYATEPATVEKIRAFAVENGYEDLVGLGGKHHEIYIGDPRKSSPEKLKTILRHPVRAHKT